MAGRIKIELRPPSKWLKLKRLTVSSVGENAEHLKLSCITGRSINGTTILNNCLAVYIKLSVHMPCGSALPLLE